MSVMVLIGLAGELRSMQHAQETARALNRMQPRLLSALRLIPVPGTPLHDGQPVGRVPPPGGNTPAEGSGLQNSKG
jgi:hypothetical protein